MTSCHVVLSIRMREVSLLELEKACLVPLEINPCIEWIMKALENAGSLMAAAAATKINA